MRLLLRFVLPILFFAGLKSCILFKKDISKPVVVKIEDTLFLPNIDANINEAKYVYDFTQQQLTEAFLTGFRTEARYTKNVTYDPASTNPDFIIKLKYLTIKESDFPYKINDPKSELNGQEAMLTKVEVTVGVEVFDVKKNKIAGISCQNSKSKSENISNNRNIGDLLTGSNKEKTKYRTKLMREDIAKDLTMDVGRRIWVPISKRIASAVK